MSFEPTSVRRLGKYIILDIIGRGGMGVVYRGHDPMLNRDVALKVLPEFPADDVEGQVAISRFHKEATAVAALRHPNIIAIHEFGYEGSAPFIVMEYVPGSSVADAIADHRPFTHIEKVRMLCSVCDALQHAHDRGIVHRDVKPGNIRIDDSGDVKLLDFGIAQFTDRTRTHSVHVCGTPAYLAPEVIAGGDASPKSDVFAVGVTLFEWLAFEKPFDGDNIARLLWSVMHEPAPNLIDVRPGVSPHVARVVAKALAKDPEQRYHRADELKTALQRALAEAAQEPTVVWSGRAVQTTPGRVGSTARRLGLASKPALVVGAVVVAVAMGVISLKGILSAPASAVPLATRTVATDLTLRLPAATQRRKFASERDSRGSRQEPGAIGAGVGAVDSLTPPAESIPDEQSAHTILAPIGTRILASLLEDLNTSRIHTGDSFRAALDEPIRIGSDELAPAGTTVYGRVFAVGSPGRPFVELVLTEIAIPGGRALLRTSVYRVVPPPSASPTLSALILGAAGGAAVGGVTGGKSGAVIGAAAGASGASHASESGAAYISGAHMAFKLAESFTGTIAR